MSYSSTVESQYISTRFVPQPRYWSIYLIIEWHNSVSFWRHYITCHTLFACEFTCQGLRTFLVVLLLQVC